MVKGLVKGISQHWYDASRRPPWVLRGLSMVFRGLAALRRLAYTRGLLAVYRAPVPLIVVGNITVGGSGKTPLVVWLVEKLRAAGYRPGVISRGYGGRAKHWPQAVTATSDPRQVGDEAVLIARRCDCPMTVGPKRAEAIKQLLEHHPIDVIVSDDGLQHYAMARDLEIAVIDGERRLGNGRCLPAGPLREPATRLQSVDFIVSNGDAGPGEFAMQLVMQQAVKLCDPSRRKSLDEFDEVHAVAGIGHPQRFFKQLQAQGLALDEHPFDDHHPFTAADLNFNGGEVLMTEKDAVKCLRFAQPHFWYVPVLAKLDSDFESALLARLQHLIEARKT